MVQIKKGQENQKGQNVAEKEKDRRIREIKFI